MHRSGAGVVGRKGVLAVGKVAIITGGSGDIGAAVSHALRRDGYTVVVFDITEPSTSSADAWFSVDVRSAKSIDDATCEVHRKFGTVDALVNCAGVARRRHLLELSEEEWDTVLDINLKGTFLATRAAAKKMARPGGNGGAIVNISSQAAITGNTDVNYVASKAGVIGFTRAAARDLAPFGVRVNCIAPNVIEGEMIRGMSEERLRTILAQTPLGRPGTPMEVAEAVAFLCSDKASYITGATIPVTGGQLMW